MFLLNERMYKLQSAIQFDECFDNILKGKNIEQQLIKLERLLKDEFNIDAKIKIPKRSPKELYGMRIYPSREELRRMALEVIETKKGLKFVKCKGVVIEIDRKLLNPKIGITNRELTAILLHEIGHKIYSNDHIKEYNEYLRRAVIAEIGSWIMIFATTSAVSAIIITSLSLFYHNINTRILSDNTEIQADSLPVKYGYAVEISSSLKKLSNWNKPKKNKKDVETFRFLKRAFESISHLGVRRNQIPELLKQELKEADSEYQKKIIMEQLEKLEELEYE